MGGTCGDLLTAMLDCTDAEVCNVGKVDLPKQRQQLKKSYIFENDLAKDVYISEISKYYKSIPSHDIEYHVIRKHSFIGIFVEKQTTAEWAATRFKKVNENKSWNNVIQSCNIQTAEDYAKLIVDYGKMITTKTNSLCSLENILEGKAVDFIEDYTKQVLSERTKLFYNDWLQVVHNSTL